MLRAIPAAVGRVASGWDGVSGLASSAMGALSGALNTTVVVPTWVWLVFGATFLFVKAVRSQIELDAEKARTPLPEPSLPLADVVRRIMGDDFPVVADSIEAANHPRSGEVRRALEAIRERAINGHLVIFGGANWRKTRPADWDHMPRQRIPAEYWGEHRIDAIEFFGDRRARLLT